ncbi:unnamed protein product [Protopolystoma xenopodis]|uniref:Uncharacterized protein n=1 Tax=Protopolystoma xenopodis TaxID=117903 RepID=A0A3S5CKZ0_9PLAT|nr:unnamed protein product [Protopolystoma xenopodis]
MPRQYAKLSLTLTSSNLLFIRFIWKRMFTASISFRFLIFCPYEASLSVASSQLRGQ